MNAMQETLTPLAWIGGTILLLGFLFLRLRNAAGSRPGSALGPFLRHFEAEGVPVEVAATAFQQLSRWMEAQDRRFAVRHDQDLLRVYGLVPGEIDAALARMARECGRHFDPASARPTPVTVADLVRALARCPEQPR